ncbi:FAD-linked oxidoreductase [Athelia psychrophila]|uniref:Proline dehydrogenase n=1 Tax=Athelia psychrophila TaxID=1759441 RepID=A0A166PES7_9AGAM|nr:FAD-linked oxidoreductase [Fibularhizoctonia sp. CBS 109695]
MYPYLPSCVPALVDVAPALLRTLLPLPVLGTITEALVRHTFFAQFVGGDTAQAALADCGKMRVGSDGGGGRGVLFAYSVEVDEDAPPPAPGSVSPHQAIVEEMIHSIDVAADFEDRLADAQPSGRRTWVAVKMTALLPDPESLIKLSSHLLRTRPASGIDFPGCANPADLDVLYSSDAKANNEHPSSLTAADIIGLRELHTSLRRICTRAQERGVRIIMDAEYTWYQPAIDALSLSLSREFNRLPPAPASAPSWWPWSAAAEKDTDGAGQVHGEQPLVYATYQAYLRRTPAHLLHDLALARRDGYALGVKLVRGAYHSYELAAFEAHTPASSESASAGSVGSAPAVTKGRGKTPSKSIAPTAPYPPVWLEKADSDACYDACARVLVREVAASLSSPRVSVLFGTHNWESCDAILGEMADTGLARVEGQRVLVKGEAEGRVLFGQLYGMSDALTDSLVFRTITQAPFVLKYVPYGALQDVMPYLSRRAIENKSVLSGGAAADERRRVGRAIKVRIFG